MKRIVLLLLSAFALNINAQWAPAGDNIKTQWAEKIDVNNVLPEYPRPLMMRKDWVNLNGLWNYAILDKGSNAPTQYDGQILVPFPIESALSGVGKRVNAKQELWYEREFTLPRKWNSKHILLHFGAVDYKADVWINDSLVCSHEGGYTQFTTDISYYLYKKGVQKIVVRVWDPTDEGKQPRGKQVNNPGGIWYTPVTGIWQTVWLEPVYENYFTNLRIIPNIDEKKLRVESHPSRLQDHAIMEVEVFDGDKKVASGKSRNGQYLAIEMPEDMKLWTPDHPFLYTLKVILKKENIVIDEFESYAAMRSITKEKDENGIYRLCLNHKPIFMYGPLDQGWWPDGLYTAPTDEALAYDIRKTKEWGFNMIRKHIKVEPARWYTYCDQIGILVWQDMPSGDDTPIWQNLQYFDGQELVRSRESETQYLKDWTSIINQLYSNPSVAVWVPFNEAWGQFKTKQITDITKTMDPTRLVNSASGGNHFKGVGDILDIHNYPQPNIPFYDADRITVLGEYGGIGLQLDGHLWEQNRNWGYVQYKNKEEVTNEYVKYAKMLEELIPKGCSAAVYTQTTDVEVEVNGIMTYDRKEIKMDEETIKAVNRTVINSMK